MSVHAPEHLQTVAQARSVRSAQPKGEIVTRLEEKDTARKLDDKKLAEFRKAVWARDEGMCRLCGRKCKRTLALDPARGECHHVRGRNVTPEDRYTVSAALLLCLECHGSVQGHRMACPKP